MTRTIMIMAGGTGGHVFPGLAVADELRARGWDVVWMGAPSGMEARLVPQRGYRMAWVRASAARGKGALAKLLLPTRLLFAFWQSAREIFRVRPDVVLGMGGYVAFPGGMMASLFAKPLAIHEQNAIAGLTNRILAALADTVMVAFPGALKNAEWTGNPVRAEIAALALPAERYARRSGPLRLLVVGGSLGARALNECVPQALVRMPQEERPRVVHQAGEKNLEALRAAYAAAGLEHCGGAPAELLPFIDDMARRYAEADLVICRAGAITVAELSAGGVPAILVPFPFAVDDHQSANARFLASKGAAVLLPEAEMSADSLAALIGSFDRARLATMAAAARALGKPDAARVVAERCAALAEGGAA
jgi:UDP-N-acetylglucosamine--N-acetylmuramyl-(pentapeptide) pyrophosphoryl-undecaprenol N-acetylglucosamine transferase